MTRYFRLSGGGNDFLAVSELEAAPTPERIRAWCRRGLSAGADGVFRLERIGGGAAGVRMTYWNADGSEAALCLNGTRCAARLAAELGWWPGGDEATDDSAPAAGSPRKFAGADAAGSLLIETGAGPVRAQVAGPDRFELELPPPESPPEPVEPSVNGTAYRGYRLMVGVPHVVLEWPRSLAEAPVESLGRSLRRHPDFAPEGANVHFVRLTGRRSFEIRSFERGVEAETLACGTGILAAAAVGVGRDALELPVEAVTLGGTPFTVGGTLVARGRIATWTLTGDARLVARGTLLPGAERLPQPPVWS